MPQEIAFAETPLSSFRLTKADLAKLATIRDALESQIPPGVRQVTIADALRHAIDGTATAYAVNVKLPAHKSRPPGKKPAIG